VIVGAFIIAAIVTPPDVLSQLMLAIPMVLLYELGIVAAVLIGKRPASESAEA
jgi:sec-independent protein translocase protein TatC